MSAIPKIDRPFESDESLVELVDLFERKTLSYERWTHRAHLGVATTYLSRFQFDEALDRIRNGIQAYNRFRGDSVGYHETLTVFFMRLVSRELHRSPPVPLADFVNGLAARFPFSIVYGYYSKELLWASVARAKFVEPDVQPLAM